MSAPIPLIKYPYLTIGNGQIIDRTVLGLKGERFMHRDLPEDGILDVESTPPLMKYGEMNGWSILKGLIDIILYYRPYCVVEIGCGLSTPILAQAAENAGVKMYSCDMKESKAISYGRHHFHSIGLSCNFIKKFDETPAIVLIDGNHNYETAKMEFDFFFDKLVSGGVIFIHDTYPPHERKLAQNACGDVYRLRQELETRTDEMDCFTWPYTAGWDGLTQVIKKEKERPYWGK